MAHEETRTYLEQVGAQIRWRRARKLLCRELADHIADQEADYRGAGLPEEEAARRAVAEMGDPVEVGRALDRLHRPQNRWELALFLLLLLAAGLAAQALLLGGGDALARQIAGVVGGAVLFLLAWHADYTVLLRRRWAAPLALAGITAASLCCLFFSSVDYTGRLYPSTPVYFTLLLPPVYALAIGSLRGRGWGTVLLCALAAPVLCIPALLVPWISVALVACAAMLLVLGTAVGLGWFSCKKPLGFLCAWGAPGGLAALLFLRLAVGAYTSRRWQAFLHPEADPMGGGFFFLTIRSGTPGTYLARSNPELMLFQLSTEHGMGRWAFLLAGVLFVLFALLVLRRVWKLRSTAGKLAALGVLWVILLQAVLFVVYNLGYSLTAPLSLPFLSYGAGFMAANLLLAGLLLSVLRMDALARDSACPAHELLSLPDTLSLPLPGGTLHIQWDKKHRETS